MFCASVCCFLLFDRRVFVVLTMTDRFFTEFSSKNRVTFLASKIVNESKNIRCCIIGVVYCFRILKVSDL